MKRFVKFLMIILVLAGSTPVFAKAKPQGKKNAPAVDFKYPYEYRVVANDIPGVDTPYQSDDYVVFTAEKGPRHIGIAFDFEDYKQIHSFMKKSRTDIDDNEIDSFYFYILELPKDIESISYRIIVDGIWTTDPTNENKYYNPYTGIEVSTLDVKNYHKNETSRTDAGVHFIYEGPSGQRIRIGGTFTNWDSWIYELTETKPGYYEIYIPLPRGTYYYSFYNGTKAFADSTNPDRAWSNEGREASIIVVP
ncbi:MAG: isoamylase [Treponema sp.]|uniref:isoamylase n=1 Tax=Treponema sp. TaxID=166 RepID=UPI00298E51EA|nr:isoamylase [Treponema sp.]MCR5386532.1 isoamylase [Treponema sp.]